MDYTNNEYADMHLMYGMASCNASKAQRLYARRYRNRRVPDRKTFERVDQRLRETGKNKIIFLKTKNLRILSLLRSICAK